MRPSFRRPLTLYVTILTDVTSDTSDSYLYTRVWVEKVVPGSYCTRGSRATCHTAGAQ